MQANRIILLFTCSFTCFFASFSQTPEEYFAQGSDQFNSGNFNGAIASYTKCIELLPDDLNAYYGRARSKAELNDFAGCIQDLDTFLLAVWDYGDAWLLMGYAMQQVEKYEDSYGYLTMAMSFAPDNANIHLYRGYAAYMTNDTTNCLADLTKAIELGTTEPGLAYYCRGHTRGLIADYTGAIEDLTKAIELNSSVADTWYFRCIAKIETADNTGGCADCIRAAELGNADAAAILTEYCN